MAQFTDRQPWEYRERNQEFWSQDPDTGVNNFDWAGATGAKHSFSNYPDTVHINNTQDPNLITDPNDPRLNQSHRRPDTPRPNRRPDILPPRGYTGMMKYLNEPLLQSGGVSNIGYGSRDQFLGHVPMDQRGGYNPRMPDASQLFEKLNSGTISEQEMSYLNNIKKNNPEMLNKLNQTPKLEAPPLRPEVPVDNDMISQSPFSNMEFRPQQEDNLMDMAQKVPIGKDLPTDLAGSTQYVKDIIDKGFNRWQEKGNELANEQVIQNNIAKIMSPTQEEQRFMNTDQAAPSNLRQMAREIDVSNPESVREFQKAAGLKEDGIFGPKSHAKLREIQGLADDYDKYKNPSLMNYAQNSETMEKKIADFEKKKPAPWFKGNEWEAEQNRRGEANEIPSNLQGMGVIGGFKY